jgi:16S rRNA (uracil1498-N3)-methyltransferase
MTQFQRIAISPNQLQNGLHYLVRVLRLRDGDKFIAIDGTGRWWLTVLQGESGQVLESLEIQTELPVSVTLLLALPKGSGFDDIVRVATELGVVKIVPVLSERTLLNPSPQKLERWRLKKPVNNPNVRLYLRFLHLLLLIQLYLR